MSPGELDSVGKSIPLEDLIDSDSKEYKKQQLHYMLYDHKEKLLESPALMKTPVVRNGPKATVGFDPETWQTWISDSSLKK